MGRVPLQLALLAACAAACADDLQIARAPSPDTFGQELYDLSCQRVGYSEALAGHAPVDVSGDLYRTFCRSQPTPPAAPPKVQALAAHHQEIVQTVDLALPHAYLPRLSDLLGKIGPLFDDGTVQAGNDELGRALQSLAADDAFLNALSRMEGRDGYRPLGSPSLGLGRAVLAYPGIDALLGDTLRVIDDGGVGNAAFSALCDGAGHELVAAQPHAEADRPLALALGLGTTHDPAFATGHSYLTVQRDARGLAQAADPTAFLDGNGDGQPDADGFGHLLLRGGQQAPAPFAVPGEGAVSRDSSGRAVSAQGRPLYVTVELDDTVAAALLRQARTLVDPGRDTALGLIGGARALLGPPGPQNRTLPDGSSITFQGHDPQSAPLLDLLYAYDQLLADPNFQRNLDQLVALLRNHEDLVARVVASLVGASDAGKRHPEAAIPVDSTLYDELLPVVRDILTRPGLAEDLLRALSDPRTRRLGPLTAALARYKDRFDVDQQTQAAVGAFATVVDRESPDSGFNRSLLQRLLHLINDSDGARHCSKAGAQIRLFGLPLRTFDNDCDLFEIPDLAVFYLQTIARLRDGRGNLTSTPKAHLALRNLGLLGPFVSDDLLEQLSGIHGFTSHPTTEAINRALYLDPLPDFLNDTMDPIQCKLHQAYRDHHPGSIFAWEAQGFYDALRPLVQAFADHEAEPLLVQLMVVLHRHWPSGRSSDHQTSDPSGPTFVFGDGAVSYELLLAEVLDGDLLPALADTSAPIDSAVLLSTARFLVDPSLSPGLHGRDGRAESLRNDGTDAGPVTPLLLLADAYHARRLALDHAGAMGDAWRRATSNLVDDLASTTGSGAQTRFANPTLRPLIFILASWLEARVEAHRADLLQWTRQRLPADTEDLLEGPTFVAAADLGAALESDDRARSGLYGLLSALVQEGEGGLAVTLPALIDLAQQLLDEVDAIPLLRGVGRLLAAPSKLPQAELVFLHRVHDADQTQALADLVKQLFQQEQPGRTPFEVLGDVISEVQRERPGAGGLLTAADYRSVFQQVADFIHDEQRGLARFADIVKHRRLQ
jgi:hypothetical protein